MKGAVLLACVVATAAMLRLSYLDNRPMHCDEAVHAVKFAHLLEQNRYQYDPYEYHGPTLNYFTLPSAWSASARDTTDVTERQLRLVPALAGIALVILVLGLRAELGPLATWSAAFFTACSPAMVFYSRYYIQEMLLVCFTFAAIVCLWRWLDDARRGSRYEIAWLVLLGVFLGLAHATKETSVICFFALLVASIAIKPVREHLRQKMGRSALVMLPTAVLVSGLFCSSFLNHPRGWLDSYLTYFYYAARALGEGSAGEHVYPWYHYLRVFFWWQTPGDLVWSELPIALLALVGLGAAASSRGLAYQNVALVRFLAVYAIVMMVVYATLSYKTPWCGLGFMQGLLLLAGVGASVLVQWTPNRWSKCVVGVLLLTVMVFLGAQCWRTCFRAYEDPHNPYVYAHPTSDILAFAEQIREITAHHPDSRAMHVQVICPDDDYWPLPWYLRDLSRIGWFQEVPRDAPAPLIITQPSLEPAITQYLYIDPPPGQRYLYMRLKPDIAIPQWRLRPQVPLLVFVRNDLWQNYEAERSQRR